MSLISSRRLNAQKSLREEGDNIVELGTQVLDRISPPALCNIEPVCPVAQLKLPDIVSGLLCLLTASP